MSMMDDLSLNTMPIEMLARLQGGQSQGMMNNPLLRIARMRAMMGQGARQAPGAPPEIPPDVAARLAAVQGMGAGPSMPPDAGVSIPFPGMTDQGPPPGAHPAQGYLDRAALGIAGTQFPGVNPYSSQGQQFTQALLPSLARAWAGQRIAPIQQQADFDQSQAQTRAQMVQANLAAQLKAAEDKNTEAAKAANEPLVPLIDWRTGKPLLGPNGEVVNGRKSVAEQFEKLNTARMDQARLDLERQKELREQTTTSGLGPSEFAGLTETESGGRPFLDVSQFGPKDKPAAQKWAVANGIPAVSKDQADAVRQVDNAKRNLDLLENTVTKFLPPDWQSRPAAIPKIKLQKLLQTSGDIASYGAWRSAAIQMMRAAAGSKGLRINQAEILQSAANDIPQLTDDLPTAMARINAMKQQLDSVVQANLGRGKGASPKRITYSMDSNGNLTPQ